MSPTAPDEAQAPPLFVWPSRMSNTGAAVRYALARNFSYPSRQVFGLVMALVMFLFSLTALLIARGPWGVAFLAAGVGWIVGMLSATAFTQVYDDNAGGDGLQPQIVEKLRRYAADARR